MALPRLLLVHGAWHGSWAWDRLLPVLADRGWDATVVDLPSSGSRAGVAADSAVVRAALTGLSGPVVAVGHSYGGYPVTDAAAGLEHVVGLVYMTAARPEPGVPTWERLPEPGEPEPWP